MIYRLAGGWPAEAAQLEEALAREPFAECGATQQKSCGWVAPRGAEHGALVEDPVTGSANACIAHLMAGADYRVRQGTCLQRDGRVSVRFRDGHAWIGGACLTVIEGTILA